MKAITANDLNSKGISVLEDALENQAEGIISVRGETALLLNRSTQKI